MRKWLFLMVLVVVYFTFRGQHHSADSLPTRSLSPSWAVRSVAGLKINLPCPLPRGVLKTTDPQPNIFREAYEGECGGYFIGVSHVLLTNHSGGIMLESASKPLMATARDMKFQVRSINTETTLINGIRARRSDYSGVINSRPTQIMAVFLTRGSNAWLIEVHAAANDSKAEAFFLKIANSAKEVQ